MEIIKRFSLEKLVRPNVKLMKAYSSARDEFEGSKDQYIFMNANESPIETDINRYPNQKQDVLRESLAKLKGVSKESILLGNGSDELLDLVFRVFCEPSKDNVITLPPTYGMYEVLAGLNNVELKSVPLTAKFQPDIKGICEQIDSRTKAIFLCSPNNPSGNLLETESIRELLEDFSGLIVVDEAYIDFASGPSWIESLTSYPHLIVLQTFSKAWGMAGIRLGVCYASPEIIAVLTKVKLPYNVNSLSENRALDYIGRIEEIKNNTQLICDERDSMIGELETMRGVQEVFKSDANFLLFRCNEATRVYKELLEHGIVIRDRSNLTHCQGALRVSIGTPSQNTKFLTTLKTILQE